MNKKKTYVSPTIDIINVEMPSILAGSGQGAATKYTNQVGDSSTGDAGSSDFGLIITDGIDTGTGGDGYDPYDGAF
jgi:hypothetical protein